MSNQESTNPWHDQVTEAVKNLQVAIKKAPIIELQAVIVKDLKLVAIPDWQHLRDYMDDLLIHAALGHPESIREVFVLRSKLESILGLLGGGSRLPEGESKSSKMNPHQRADAPKPDSRWREEVNNSANILCSITKQHLQTMEQELEKAMSNLPQANFSFPLDRLMGATEPPDRSTRLVSDLCDRLIQRRFDAECKRVINNLTDKPAEDQSLPRWLKAKSRDKHGPTELTREIFYELERERTIFSSQEEWEKLIEREKSMPSPRDKLKKGKKSMTSPREKLIECKNSMPSPRQLLKKLVDEQKQDAEKAINKPEPDRQNKVQSAEDPEARSVSYPGRRRKVDEQIADEIRIESDGTTQILVIRVELYEEQLLYGPRRPPREFQPEKSTNPQGLELERQSHWTIRAALLPPLSNDRSVIKEWVEAAVCWIICRHGGNLETASWAVPISNRITKTKSVLAGLQLFLREGFETLAGKDRKKYDP